MKQYLDLLRQVLLFGEEKSDRTGTGTLSLFGLTARYDLRAGFPLVTTKKVLFDAVVRELLWFLSGSTNINDGLKEYTPIWNAWADEDGSIGKSYGYQWIKSSGNQIQSLIDGIKNNPDSRRHIVSAWNVQELPEMNLAPCHILFQCYVADKYLDLCLYQRSADMCLGVPFNIASYSLLLAMLAKECNLTPRYFIHNLGDAHIYLNHVEGAIKQLQRSPLPAPKLEIADKPFWDIKFEDIKLADYVHHPFIKFEVAV